MKFKGSVTVFVMILFGLIIGTYLMGFTTPIMNFVGQEILEDEQFEEQYDDEDPITPEDAPIQSLDEPLSLEVVLVKIRDSIFSVQGLAFLGLTAAFAIIAGLIGANYIGQSLVAITIPCFLLFIIANLFFFPTQVLTQTGGVPTEISFLMTIIFNVLLLLAVTSFISGRN
jgi:hypothetical protein